MEGLGFICGPSNIRDDMGWSKTRSHTERVNVLLTDTKNLSKGAIVARWLQF